MKRSWLVAGGGVLLVALAIAAAVTFFRPKPSQVATAVQLEEHPTELRISGTIRARHIVAVAAPMDGTLESGDVFDGQDIYEGQLLARIRNSRLDLEMEEVKLDIERLQDRVNNLEAQLVGIRLEASRADADASRAKAEFTAAEKDYQRQKTLLAEGATPRLTFEKAESAYQSLKAESEALGEMASGISTRQDVVQKNLEESRRQLKERQDGMEDVETTLQQGEVHAPVDGVLIAHRAGPGEEVTAAMKDLFQIATNLSELNFTAQISGEQQRLLVPGQPVLLQVAEAGIPLEGVVKSAANGELVVEFVSPHPAVKPGLSAQVRIPLEAPTSPQPDTSSGSH